MSKVKVQKGDRVLYVDAKAVENMKKYGFEAEGQVKTTRKTTAKKTKNTEVVNDESTDE